MKTPTVASLPVSRGLGAGDFPARHGAQGAWRSQGVAGGFLLFLVGLESILA